MTVRKVSGIYIQEGVKGKGLHEFTESCQGQGVPVISDTSVKDLSKSKFSSVLAILPYPTGSDFL